MNKRPSQEFLQQDEEKQVDISEQQPSLVTRWNVLAVLLIITVISVLQIANLGGISSTPVVSNNTPLPPLSVLQLPVVMIPTLDGIPRQVDLHTTIPSRPRMEVTTYTVQTGDSIFKIADNFGLKPTTILFGNYETLRDSPGLLKPGQVLNILPVDGTYYQWQGTESLSKVAEVFGVDAETIINFPGNYLDPENIGDLNNPSIQAGTWLVVPGGNREFTSWTAPAQLVRSDPSVQVWGAGVCSGISYVQVGYGSFIYPSTEHWLSGTPYRPDLKHFAVDFAGQAGNAIYATDAGTIVYSGWNDWGYGNLVIIDHGNGWQSLYAHQSAINVSCGQSVGQGDVIGLIGSTGNSTGPHLHFELMNTNLGKVNPLDFLPAP